MSNYLPHYTKKKQILEKRERELRHALKNRLGETKIRRAAERVRAAQVRALESALAQVPPSQEQRFEEKRTRLLADITPWKEVPLDALIDQYRQQD